MKDLNQKLAAALSKGASVNECKDLQTAIGQRKAEIEARLQLICRGVGGPDVPEGTWNGAERKRVIEQGTPEDLAALDREVEILRAERDQLTARASRLQQVRAAAEKREATGELPGRIKALSSVVDALEAALTAVAKAEAELTEATTGIQLARQAVGRDSAAVPAELVARIVELRGRLHPGWREPDDRRRFNSTIARFYAQMGVEAPHVARERARQAEAKRGRGEKVDLAKHPEHASRRTGWAT